MKVIKPCKVPGCENPKAIESSMCQVHRWRWSRYKSYDAPLKSISSNCKVDGCDKLKVKGHSLCSMHKCRWARYKCYDPVFKFPRQPKSYPEGIVRICNVHGELKPEETRTIKGGINKGRMHCKKCHSKRTSEHAKKQRKITSGTEERRNKDRANNLKYVFGITVDRYNEMLERQNHVCAICFKPETKIRNNKLCRLSVDHCHSTDKIRKLLCTNCNLLLGHSIENIDILQSAINYLKEHQV